MHEHISRILKVKSSRKEALPLTHLIYPCKQNQEKLAKEHGCIQPYNCKAWWKDTALYIVLARLIRCSHTENFRLGTSVKSRLN